MKSAEMDPDIAFESKTLSSSPSPPTNSDNHDASTPEIAAVVKIELQDGEHFNEEEISDSPPVVIVKRKRGRPPSLHKTKVKPLKLKPPAVKKRRSHQKPQQRPLTKNFSCDVCQKKFTRPSELQYHVYISHTRAGKFFHCKLCPDYKAVHQKTLDRHVRAKHKGENLNKLPCIFCERMFSTSTDLFDHLRTHTREEPYFCKYCDRSFKIRANLMRHLKTHTDERERIWKCSSCPKTFFTKHELNLHFRGIHQKEKKFECQICSKRFATSSDLNRHQAKHTEEKKFECEICSKFFKQRDSLRSHLALHTNKRDFKCEICGKRFKTNANLRVHRYIHEPEKLFECEVCGKRFQQSRAVVIHMKSHSTDKPYKCELCDVGYNLSTNLARHKRSPTHLANVRKESDTDKSSSISCKECGKEFSNGGMLQRHHSIAHLSESLKNLQCEVCSKRFSSKLGLKYHLESAHIGIRMKCPHCQQLFTSLTGLRTHIKRFCKMVQK